MPYRDDREALLARAADLERELTEVRLKEAELRGLKAHEGELYRQLAQVRERLAHGAALPAIEPSTIDDIRIASPCTAEWSKMVGDDRQRFCQDCGHNVYNVSSLTQAEVGQLLAQSERVCLRMFRRFDGTVMTADCPVGKRRVRLKQAATVACGALLAGAAAAVVAHEHRQAELRELYSVELYAQDHHHHLAAEQLAGLHVDGRGKPAQPEAAPPVESNYHGPDSGHDSSHDMRGGHTLGMVAAPPGPRGNKGSSSCTTPGKATLL